MSSNSIFSAQNLNFSEVFDILEKTALVKVLLSVCTFDASEKVFLRTLLQRLNMSRQQFEHVDRMTETRMYEILTAMDMNRKAVLYALLKEAIRADGEVHAEEIALLRTVCERAGIPLKSA
jgi:tellurite resistance protein